MASYRFVQRHKGQIVLETLRPSRNATFRLALEVMPNFIPHRMLSDLSDWLVYGRRYEADRVHIKYGEDEFSIVREA